MKKNYTLILLILICSIVNAQNYQWAKSIGSAGYDIGFCIAIDGSGNCFVTGGFSGTADFDPGPGTANLSSIGGVDIYFAKYDVNGNYLWAKNIGSAGDDYGMSIAIDGTGNCYITGEFEGAADFDPGPGTATLTTLGTWDVFFAKYDNNGNYLWAKSIGSTGWDNAYNITIDAAGNCYLAGYFHSTADFDPGSGTDYHTSFGVSDIFFAKYDANGNYIWANCIGSTGEDYCYSLAFDNSGYLYITGQLGGTADFDPGTGIANLSIAGGSFDIFVAKYDTAGNYMWAKDLGGTGDELGNSIAVDGAGNCFITGFFTNTADFDPGLGIANMTSAGGRDVFLAKYDVNGNYIWAESIGSTDMDRGSKIILDNLANCYITGIFTGTADFDPGAGTANYTPIGGSDVFFAKYDANGNYLWAKNVGSASDDQGFNFSLDSFGNCYITGYFQGTADFDPGVGIANLLSIGGNDIFFAKYCQVCTPLVEFIASDSTICASTCINFTDLSSGSPTSWNWTFAGATPAGSTMQNPTNICYANPGTYPVTLIINNVYGADTISHNIIVSPLPVISAIAVTDTVCNGSCTDITASGAIIYSWMPGGLSGSTVNVCPTTTTTYSVTGTSAAGCTGSTTVTIAVNPLPTVTANATSSSICDGQCTNLIGGGASIYSWMPGGLSGTTVNVCPTTTTTYSVTGTSAAGCTGSTTVTIAVNPLPTVTANATSSSICDGQCTNLIGGGASIYSWMPGGLSGTTVNVCPTTTTTYSVTGTTASGCTGSAILTVNVNPLPDVTTSSTNAFCNYSDGSATATTFGGTSPYTYLWNTMPVQCGATASNIPIGNYYVTVTDANGCSKTAGVFVNSTGGILTAIVGTDITIILGDNVQLNASGGTSYLWTPSTGLSCLTCPDPIASPDTNTTYCVIVSDTGFCPDTACITISIDFLCGDVYVPSAFSPNDDGKNDVLYVRGNCITSMTFAIYNRWGEEVFESKDPQTGWDGRFHKKPCNAGVFVWYLYCTLHDGTEIGKKGNITLFR